MRGRAQDLVHGQEGGHYPGVSTVSEKGDRGEGSVGYSLHTMQASLVQYDTVVLRVLCVLRRSVCACVCVCVWYECTYLWLMCSPPLLSCHQFQWSISDQYFYSPQTRPKLRLSLPRTSFDTVTPSRNRLTLYILSRKHVLKYNTKY